MAPTDTAPVPVYVPPWRYTPIEDCAPDEEAPTSTAPPVVNAPPSLYTPIFLSPDTSIFPVTPTLEEVPFTIIPTWLLPVVPIVVPANVPEELFNINPMVLFPVWFIVGTVPTEVTLS